MGETPRKKLTSLIDGLELPKGFKLTTARQGALRALGMHIIKMGKLRCYYDSVAFSHIEGGYALDMNNSEKAALRGMREWLTVRKGDPAKDTRWYAGDVVFATDLEPLALRLGARQLLWDERRQDVLEGAREARDKVRAKLHAARSALMEGLNWRNTENDAAILKAVKDVRELSAVTDAAEQELEAVYTRSEGVPEPTADEAFVWLMERKLRGDDVRK